MQQQPVAILVSGLVRSFHDNLFPFLKQLPSNYHLYLSFAPADTSDHFLNNNKSFDYLLECENVKLLIIDTDIPQMPSNLSEREQNVIIHWYRLKKLLTNVPNEYAYIFRCRPDIKFAISPEQFIQKLTNSFIYDDEDTINIPIGFDIFNEQYRTPNCVNDQIAYGSRSAMYIYCQMYDSLDKDEKPIVSEQQLCNYLLTNNLRIVRTDIPYKLVLSKCFTIAICGDSGAGKSSLSKLIQSVLPYDQSLLFETDRYHKWERGATEYNTMTHLNPNANHLERLSSDTFKLSVGEDIYAVDYDHKTGKFTEPRHIKSNKFMLFCGLHTLHQTALNDIYNLKIYLDTDPILKQHWKIQRDIEERGTDKDTVIKTIKKREPDYEAFIKPQQAAADMVIHLYAKDGEVARVTVDVSIKQPLVESVNNKLLPFLREEPIAESETDSVLYKFREIVTAQELNSHIITHGCNLKINHDNYEGIIKYLIISLLWK